MELFGRVFMAFLAAGSAAWGSAQMAVFQDKPHQTITLSDRGHELKLRLSYARRCVIESLAVRGKQVLSGRGVASAVKVAGKWFSTASEIPSPQVRLSGGKAVVSGIRFGGNGFEVEEVWTFEPSGTGLKWIIERTYPGAANVEDVACPNWSFAGMSTWTGALLATGGVAWCKLFDAPNASYAMHSDSATFWNATTNVGLEIRSNRPDMAMRFTREPDSTFTLACEVTGQEFIPAQGQYRFYRDRASIWKPIVVPQGRSAVTYTLRALDYAKESRGDLKGLNGDAVREILNTIGRIGVIDDRIVGSNGWYSGYAVLHEPWFALMAGAVDDPGYFRNLARTLDYQRDVAIQPDGMVKSRWAYFTGDARPGTYDDRGFYECQWGRLMDTQTSYAINVAELFELIGDLGWVRAQKKACERALDYLVRRDTNGNGLFEMAVDSRFERKSSDWLDVICASFENAFVNAQAYRALVLWSDIERLLGDQAQSKSYASQAAKLKVSFNKPIEKGGFWDPKNQWYVYWRDKDGSVHGNNLTLPVNFMSIGYGLCDDSSRRKAILDRVEREMSREKLFCWPVNVYPFTPDETGNQPFPTYENGDIFLAWAEMGIRAYADYDPRIALKYVKNVLDRYDKDGLAFQRYLRRDQAGAGDDILANNCSAVIGLYRDIYGIQPKYNRIYLAPRMTPDIEGSVLRYWLRDHSYRIAPSTRQSWIECDGCRVLARGDFGVRFQANATEYFAGEADAPSLTVRAGRPLRLEVEKWGSKRQWSLVSRVADSVSMTVHGLKSKARYLVRYGHQKSSPRTSGTGDLSLAIRTRPRTRLSVSLEPK